MQFDLQRAFPYPVLRPQNDDYIDGDFQVSVVFDVSEDLTAIKAKILCALSVDELENMIQKRKASYVIIISCRDTFLRHVERQFTSEFEIEFPPGHLKGEVMIYPFVASVDNIEGFTSDLINPEWAESGPFSFEPGAVLATEQPQQIYIDRELFKPITSVFVLVKNDNIQNYEWHVVLDDDKVKISVSPEVKEIIDRVRNTTKNRAVLLNSIYFGAVMHCIRHLKSSDEFDGYRWAMVIRHQAVEANINIDTEDEYLVAQKLLQLPLNMLTTYVFPEDT